MSEFVETNALIAVMDGDRTEAIRLLSTLLPGELRVLADSCDTLSVLARRTLGDANTSEENDR